MISKYKKVNRAIDKYVAEVATKILQNAQNNVPVDTGNLKNSIEVIKKEENERLVGSNLPYAAIVEVKQPYLRPAMRDL